MSWFIFLLVVDWVMRKITEGRKTGIRRNFTSVVEDLDFVDDIALLASKCGHIQEKIKKLITEAGRLGLCLNASKCKVLRMNTRRVGKIKIRGGKIC